MREAKVNVEKFFDREKEIPTFACKRNSKKKKSKKYSAQFTLNCTQFSNVINGLN